MSSIHSYENEGVASCKCQTFTFGSGSFFNRCCLGHFPPTAGCPAALVGGAGGARTGDVFAAVFPPLFPTLAVFFMRTIFQMNSHQFSNFVTAHVFWWCHTYCTNYILCFMHLGQLLTWLACTTPVVLCLVGIRKVSCTGNLWIEIEIEHN